MPLRVIGAGLGRTGTHNAEVRRVIPAERLLVFEPSQGWGPLCAFLGVPAPNTPYPRTNTAEDWAARAAPRHVCRPGARTVAVAGR